VFNETRSILEPAGAVAVAGAKAYLQHYGLTGQTVVAITSGANMNFDRLRLVAGGCPHAVCGSSLCFLAGAGRLGCPASTAVGMVPCTLHAALSPTNAHLPRYSLPLQPPHPPSTHTHTPPPPELADVGGKREAMLAVTIPERAGSFSAFVEAAVDGTDLPITEFKYR
jgi:hypothetical protein